MAKNKNRPATILPNERNNELLGNGVLDTLYRGRLHELAMARFKWENLPPEIDERYLEMSLNETGMVAFFRDDIAEKFVVQPCLANGPWDNYGYPLRIETWNNWNSYRRYMRAYITQKEKKRGKEPDKYVVVFNNMIRCPTFPWLDYYADQLYDIDQTRSINLRAQKTPVMLRGTDKQRLTLKNLWLNYDGNTPVMIVDESVDKDSFAVLKTDAPFLGEQLTTMRRHIMGEIMIYLGYETQEATQKAERVLAGEVEAAASESMSYRYSPLIMRRQAADKINDMFGLNIEVNFRQLKSSLVEFDDPLTQLALDSEQAQEIGGMASV